jgi:hypothetical protein
MFRVFSAPIIWSTINCSLLPLVHHTWYVPIRRACSSLNPLECVNDRAVGHFPGVELTQPQRSKSESEVSEYMLYQ